MKKIYIIAVNNTVDGQHVVYIRSRSYRLFRDLKKYVNTNTFYITKDQKDAIKTSKTWKKELAINY